MCVCVCVCVCAYISEWAGLFLCLSKPYWSFASNRDLVLLLVGCLSLWGWVGGGELFSPFP